MRGLVFTEFLDFVETTAGPEMVETMLDSCDLASGGAYTSVGTYDHDEILTMLTFLHTATGSDVAEMVTAFGRNLFGQLVHLHPWIMENGISLLDFLEGIETHIHREVRKLYPDAELPAFETERPRNGMLVMHYSSTRPFVDLAHGMILGAVDHFKNDVQIIRHIADEPGGFGARFEVTVSA